MKTHRLLAAALAALALSAGGAAAETLNSTATGWYQPAGNSNSGGGNYFTGVQGPDSFRSFIVFTIPAGTTITAAQLNIFNTASGQGGPNVLGLFEVTTGTPVLVAGTGGAAAYIDLADGPSYGTAPAPLGATVNVTLNAAGISAVNAARGGTFAIGLINTTIEQANDNLFYASSVNPANQLILSRAPVATVPTMSEWAMILMGLLLAGGAALTLSRRRVV
ncbi:MAG: IPTL-CTERM sorting domain-containing protein [Caulobacterales bacterium]|nr:IPTL-CTERM sorting domain-containing protein [Caulobacterales bacterium]